MPLKYRVEISFEKCEVFDVGNQCVLYRFDQAGPELALVQALQCRYIDIDRRRVPERAECVLADTGIDAGLAADRRIGLGHGSSRYLNYGYAPFEYRGRESGNVSDRPAAEGDDEGIPAEVRLFHRLDD